MKIAFFDSGLGGLLMMESVRKKIPHCHYTYLGDTQNVPYGPREPEEVFEIIDPLLLSLVQEHDYVVVACNTVCVKALPLWIRKYPQYASKIVDIVSLTKKALGNNGETLYLLATVGTVRSQVYNDCIKPVHQYAMPGLVDMIEEQDRHAALAMVDDVVAYLSIPSKVVLGCTHYVWLQKNLQEKYPTIQWLGQDYYIEQYLATLVGKLSADVESDAEYFVTGDIDRYQQLHHLPFQPYKKTINE